MTPPVYKVSSEKTAQKVATINLLPCRIHHDGDVEPATTYWSPSENPGDYNLVIRFVRPADIMIDGTKTAHFRGRKLQGKAVKLPEGYYGSLAEKTEPQRQRDPGNDSRMAEDDEAENPAEEELEVGAMKGEADFDEIVVWGQESAVDSSTDPYMRSMEEWVTFAEQVSRRHLIDRQFE
ncbi:ribonuclease H2 non-catalytic subunit-domain-containing protein [Xylariomycetidae sp. FL0641]|nr:ribonuclease H2 non-catalytic subunit-domain-containing protein [Xylariomycetidae sp. FL0641]